MSSALRLARLLSPRALNAVAGSSTTSRTSHVPGISTSTISASTNFQQVASMMSIAHQDPKIELLPPFPYKTRRYTKLHMKFGFLDPTSIRMNTNSKVVTVEGNIGSGKENVAAKIAETFGLHYMPEPRLDDLYINHNGFDYRTLNKLIAPKFHAFDEKMFYEDPKHPAVSWFKIQFYRIRFVQYIDALAHLFNTGQGVVLERWPGTDFVFSEAMHQCGWLPKDTYDFYYRLRYDTIHKLLRPHLVIYLDSDTDSCLQRIKERNIPHQVNSKVLTKKYLQAIETAYKDKYLPDVAQYSELLVFKGNDQKILEAEAFADLVREIEALDVLDNWEITDKKFMDWNFFWENLWDEARWKYTNCKSDLLDDFNSTPYYDVDSLELDYEEADHRDRVYKSFVPEYSINPAWDKNRVGYIRSMFNKRNFAETEEWICRSPFF